MWDDQPVQRQAPPVDMPPSTRAFLSQFNRSFTPPALINDPYAVDKKLVITPLLFGPRPLHVSRNPFAVDPAVERLRHYVGCEDLTDPDLRPSPVLQAAQNDDWFPEDDETFTTEGIDGSIHVNGNSVKPVKSSRDNGSTEFKSNGSSKCVPFSRLDFVKSIDAGELAIQNSNIFSSPEQTSPASHVNRRIQPVRPDREANTESVDKDSAVNVSTPPITQVSIGSPAQSDVPTMTSWDEWDDPSDTVCRFDPMAASEDVLVVHYDPVL